MVVKIDNSFGAIDWNAKDENRIAQNVRNLLRLEKWEVAYDRTRGIDTDINDMPLHLAQLAGIMEMDRQMRFEPAARVIRMGAEPETDGTLRLWMEIDVESVGVTDIVEGGNTSDEQ